MQIQSYAGVYTKFWQNTDNLEKTLSQLYHGFLILALFIMTFENVKFLDGKMGMVNLFINIGTSQ